MAEIMSQKEIDDLIAGLSTAESIGPQRQDARVARKPRKVRVYDFRRPDKFSKEQIRTLQMIHDNQARMLTTTISAMLRTMVQVQMTSVDQMTYDEFIQSVTNPTVLGVFTLEPLAGNMVCEIQPGIAFPMIDRLLGGPGQATERVRQLTEIEQTVMERVVISIMRGFADAWKNVADLKPKLETIETNPLFAQIVGSNDMVASISLDMKLGEYQGLINFCLPFLVLEPVMSKLSAHHWFSSVHKRVTPDQQERLRGHIEDSMVPVAVVLGSSNITVGDLIGLQVGDVVKLDESVGGDLNVVVGDGVKFTAQAGTLGRKMAIKVASVVDEEGGALHV